MMDDRVDYHFCIIEYPIGRLHGNEVKSTYTQRQELLSDKANQISEPGFRDKELGRLPLSHGCRPFLVVYISLS